MLKDVVAVTNGEDGFKFDAGSVTIENAFACGNGRTLNDSDDSDFDLRKGVTIVSATGITGDLLNNESSDSINLDPCPAYGEECVRVNGDIIV